MEHRQSIFCGWMHARIQKVLPEGSNFEKVFVLGFFLVDGGRKVPNTTISGQSSARQRNAGVPMMAQH